jgi:penicillin-binding protein 1A
MTQRLLKAIRAFLRIIACFIIALIILFVATYAYMEIALPDVKPLNTITLKSAVPIDDVPKQLIQAIIATEDARFYSHPGIDLVGLARASVAVLSSGRKAQGASTITMQVARNFFLTPKKTYSRKMKEILLAIKIDYTLSKSKILELYLNKVYFGKGAYGVSQAAHIYYHKSLNELTLPEMAMIAGLPQSPSRVNPIANPQKSIKRRNHVLKRMWLEGYIDQATYLHAIST